MLKLTRSNKPTEALGLAFLLQTGTEETTSIKLNIRSRTEIAAKDPEHINWERTEHLDVLFKILSFVIQFPASNVSVIEDFVRSEIGKLSRSDECHEE